MAIVVKCDWRELNSGDVLEIEAAWIYENCRLQREDETFVCWHTDAGRPSDFEMRGVLSQFSLLGKSPTTGHPEASLQITITQRIEPTRRLTVSELNRESELPAVRELARKLKHNRHKKVAILGTDEAIFLRRLFV
ncbi:MAG TPA: hypothetical protein VFQ82_10640 [Stellaceae bacterium]|jgi:hypothetical protein|nr:hypothetical protein [Stellaceae bacterium]